MSDDLRFEYDRARDVLTVEGVAYSGGLFRGLGIAKPGDVFRVLRRDDDGVLTLFLIERGDDD